MAVHSMRNRGSGIRRLRGFSMVELMIALVVGLFLLGGIIQMLVSSRISYRVGEQASRIQENGRYVVNMFAEAARGSLSMGCRNAMMEIPLDGVSPTGDALIVNSCLLLKDATGCVEDPEEDPVIRTTWPLGYDSSESGGADWLKYLPNNNPVANRWLRGDVLVVWGTSGPGTHVSSFTAEVNADTGVSEITGVTLVEQNADFKSQEDKPALITNCEQSHLFDGQSNDGVDLTVGAVTGQTLSGNYEIPDYDPDFDNQNPLNKAAVYPFSYEAYFICCSDVTDGSLVDTDPQSQCSGASDRYLPSLCQWRAGGITQPLINGIADMRVTYSGDTDDDGDVDFRASDRNTVHTAAWVTNQGLWSKVIGAQIELLVTSVDTVDQGESLGVARFGGETKAPIDYRWSPNDPDDPPETPHQDTLGYALRTQTGNRRLFERYVISAAFRARAPWFVEP